MGLENVFYLVLGCLIGYRLAKLELSLDSIKREVDEVDALMKKRDEKGFMSVRIVRDVIVGVLVIATSLAAIWSGAAKQHSDEAARKSNAAVHRSDDAVQKMKDISKCNQQILGDLLVAVNERSKVTKPLAKSNLALQRSFRDLIQQLIHIPPFSNAENFVATQKFFKDQNTYIHRTGKQLNDVVENPLPTLGDYKICLHDRKQAEREQ